MSSPCSIKLILSLRLLSVRPSSACHSAIAPFFRNIKRFKVSLENLILFSKMNGAFLFLVSADAGGSEQSTQERQSPDQGLYDSYRGMLRREKDARYEAGERSETGSRTSQEV